MHQKAERLHLPLLYPELASGKRHFQHVVEDVEGSPGTTHHHRRHRYPAHHALETTEGEEQPHEEERHGDLEAEVLHRLDHEEDGQTHGPSLEVADPRGEEVGGHRITPTPGGVVENDEREHDHDPCQPEEEEARTRA